METLDVAVSLKRPRAPDASQEMPKDGAVFLDTSTGDVYVGDGSSWGSPNWNLRSGGESNYDHISARVYQDSGTVIGYTHDGSQYTSLSLDTVIENLSSAVNGAIAIRAGTYPWTDMCTLSNNTHIKGVGEVTLDIQTLADNPAMDLYDVTENVTIEGLRFESDGTTDGGISRRASGIPRKDHIAVRDCVLTEFINSTTLTSSIVITGTTVR